ncbi:hypothetical protein HYH03_002748 [Edaphochlamys debaryana]|uniref:phytol kinase n=1 Tax=Edaphochlamys debaryana TaxID=47281 RepID=A0A836C4X4_9CHLO|nr:hypothetical protein HYH03_002748 [Edaphochlamys debaryana]|eukprot:KAG2499167.1 hypothetical protein HYH03_002748 [Edaphochlamys debaryana]
MLCRRLLGMEAAPPPDTPSEPTRPTAAVLDFARRVVRVETLQALAARLAEVRPALEDPREGGGDAAQLQGVDNDDGRLTFLMYCSLSKAAALLLDACLALALPSRRAAGAQLWLAPPAALAAAAAGSPQSAAEDCYRLELATALRSSYIVEHIAAITLVLLRAVDGLPRTPAELAGLQCYGNEPTSLPQAMARSLDGLLRTVSLSTHALLRLAVEPPAAAAAPSYLPGRAPGQECTAPLAALSRAAALGPCASYVTLAYGMSVLSYMDGSGTRGLLEDVGRALGEPLRLQAHARLQQITGGEEQGGLPAMESQFGPIQNALYALLAAAKAAVSAAGSATLSGAGVQPPLSPHSAASALTDGANAACAFAHVSGSTSDATTTIPTPPRRLQLSWHTALGLAMRAARLGAQAEAEAEAGRTREQEAATLTAALEGRGTFRALMSEGCGTMVAGEALSVAAKLRALLLRCRGGEGGGPTSSGEPAARGQADQGAEWWRLLASVGHRLSVMCVFGVSSAEAHADCLREHLPTVPLPPEPLPPAAPPAVASALAGGALPCLERLIRRSAAAETGDAGTTQPSPELLALKLLFAACQSPGGSGDPVWGWFAPLLAFGNPHEAKALVVTLTKALSASRDSRDSRGSLLNDLLVDMTSSLLVTGRAWLDAAGWRLGRGGALTPPERQLAGLLGAAAAAWLPEASWRLDSAWRAGELATGCLLAGIRWLPLLACCSRASTATGAVGFGTPGVSDEGGSSSGEWASFGTTLFETEDILAMAFAAWTEPACGVDFRHSLAPWLAEAACALATLRPEEAAAGTGRGLRAQEVRALAAELKTRGHVEAVDALQALAAQLVRWERGGGARAGGWGGGRAATASAPPLAARYGVFADRLPSAAALLPASPGAARQLLGGCSHPACANLEGDSDAGLPLRACAGCGGAASYCSRECQTAHWRSGHREACRGGAGGGGRGGGV